MTTFKWSLAEAKDSEIGEFCTIRLSMDWTAANLFVTMYFSPTGVVVCILVIVLFLVAILLLVMKNRSRKGPASVHSVEGDEEEGLMKNSGAPGTQGSGG